MANTDVIDTLEDIKKWAKAYELLKKLELSIGDVSRSVGYIDPLTFSKTFKKYSGYSPKQYRENLYKNNL